MEKYKLALEIFDHPERFSDDELRELLNDKEILEVYNLLAGLDSCCEEMHFLGNYYEQ